MSVRFDPDGFWGQLALEQLCAPRTVRVEHGTDGQTRGYDATGVETFEVRSEDYAGAQAWAELEQ